MSKLRFGICGLGFMGQGHLVRVRVHPDAELVAVCDRDADRRAGKWGTGLGNLDYGDGIDGPPVPPTARKYADWQELTADPDIDAVLIALPTALHADVTVAALETGKHVLCEKPMGVRAADCDRMIQAQEASSRTLMIAQCIRFWPHYELIQRYIAEGRIGKVRFAALRRDSSPPDYSADNWLMDAAQSGGGFLDLHVHDVDYAQHVFGLPAEIVARGSIGPTKNVDHLVATWSYEDGRYVTLEGGWAFTPPFKFDMGITVVGEFGTLDWQLSRGEEVLLYAGGAEPERIACEGDALANELDYFIQCVRAGRPVERCLPTSTRTSVCLAWLEARAVESGKLVRVSEKLRNLWAS